MGEKKIELFTIGHIIVSILFVCSALVIIRLKNYDPRSVRIMLDYSMVLFLLMSVFNIINYLLYLNFKKNNKDSINKYTSVFNAFSEGILIFDNKFNVAYSSQRLENILGMTSAEISNDPFYDVEGVSYRDYVLSRIKTLGNINESFDVEMLNKANKKNIFLHCSIHSVISGDTRWYMVVFEDRTSIINEKETLAKRLEETSEIAEEKQNFLSRVSHEIRTPLNGIIGMNEIAIENLHNKDYESLEDSLEKISFSSNYLLSIIENVLSMSRIESGKLLIDYKPFSFVSFLNEIKTVVKAQLDEKEMNFTIIKNFYPKTIDKQNPKEYNVSIEREVTKCTTYSILAVSITECSLPGKTLLKHLKVVRENSLSLPRKIHGKWKMLSKFSKKAIEKTAKSSFFNKKY